MSHILDALQKVQEEKAAKLKQATITGGVLLDAGGPRPPKNKRFLLAGIASVALLIGVVAFWLIQRPTPQARQKRPMNGQQLALQQPSTVVTPPPVAVPEPQQTTPAALPAVQQAAPIVPAQPKPDDDDENRPSRRDTRTNASIGAASPVPSALAAPVTIGTPEGIKLSGIAWHDNRKLRRAVINDLLVAEGAEVAGARIMEIRTGLVKIEKNGILYEAVLHH
jgi:general secretion pathway protein B